MLVPNSSTALARSLLDIAQNPRVRDELDQTLGEYCHQSRNRLNSLKLSIHLARRQTTNEFAAKWAKVAQEYQILEQQLDRLQTVCRPMKLSPVQLNLGLLFDDRRDCWMQMFRKHGRHLVYAPPDHAAAACFDVIRLGNAFDLLVEWRSQTADLFAPVTLSWSVDRGTAHILWSEGQGHPALEPSIDPVFDSAWALPLLLRVISEHGGQLTLNEAVGWQLEMSWPAQPGTDARMT